MMAQCLKITALQTSKLKIAVVGTGISGLAAAWLLNRSHDLTVFEKLGRVGGHTNTVEVQAGHHPVAVDTGFIVYNPLNYPNLVALFGQLGVETRPTHMSFAVSRKNGDLEYAGTSLRTLFAQPSNVLSREFWSMLTDLRRFYKSAPDDLAKLDARPETLGQYLSSRSYGPSFRDNHLLPMAAAIWSAPPSTMMDYSAAAFIRFFSNHGLLQFNGRPSWRTVVGGSEVYLRKLTRGFSDRIRKGNPVVNIRRESNCVWLRDAHGTEHRFDHVVLATHADQALQMLGDASKEERRLLGVFRYTSNTAVLHSDASFMPKHKSVWSSWNYVETDASQHSISVTYWINRLQGLDETTPFFVTLNPSPTLRPSPQLHTEIYEHPIFNVETDQAQRDLWSLQGQRRTWFCGAYFGAGFHEDGLQAGLGVAEDLGGELRPWSVPSQSARIFRKEFDLAYLGADQS